MTWSPTGSRVCRLICFAMGLSTATVRADEPKTVEDLLDRVESRLSTANSALEEAEKSRKEALDKAAKSELAEAKKAAEQARKKVREAEQAVTKLRDENRELRAELRAPVAEPAPARVEAAPAPVEAAPPAPATETSSTPPASTVPPGSAPTPVKTEPITRSQQARIENSDHAREALESAVTQANKDNEAVSDDKLEAISLKNGDTIEYGLTLAAARLRVTRSPNEAARLRDYQPEAEFVPTLIGFRVVYSPSGRPWRVDSKEGKLQLLSIEFPLYLEKAKGTSLAAVSAGVGLTFVNGLIGIGLAFDVYRAVPVAGGTTKIGILPWALSRTGEVTAENVAIILTLGLDSLVGRLSGGTNDHGGQS